MSTISASTSSTAGLFNSRINSFFQKADTDGSGGVSLDEFKALPFKKTDDTASIENLFKSMDADGDGQVTESEMDTFAKQSFQKRMAQGGALSGDNLIQAAASFANGVISKVDTDGDGSISLDEFKAAKPEDTTGQGRSAEDIFKSLDKDGDGKVTSAELQQAFKDKVADASAGAQSTSTAANTGLDADGDDDGDTDATKASGGKGAHHAHRGHGGGGGGAGAADSIADDAADTTSATTFDPLDTNKDGVVSEAERMAGLTGGVTGKASINTMLSQMLSSMISMQEAA